MKKWFRIAMLAAVLSVAAGLALAQSELWVTSSGAKLKEERRATSGTVVEVAVGAKLSVLASEGSWYWVATEAGENGWIYRGKVSATAPEAEGGGGLFGSFGGSSIDVASADTSRSIRGLSPEAEVYAEKAGTDPKYKMALDEVLAWDTSEQKVETFLAAGKIGEYGE
jgi:hypothetical protein